MVKSATLSVAQAIVAAVKDPELPSITIEELGILRDVRMDGDTVVVSITPTYSGCPAMDVITEDIVAALRSHFFESRVETVLSPAWTTDWLSPSAREKLRQEGVAAPGQSMCPVCDSENVRTVSEFGSVACQALHACISCGEPFSYFKPLR
ncbi:MAG: phenylacetate-CoA oxygenase subunit PaaJ [Acidimicrobiia bacterium]|nr:phenylacetate-CoA oxygenase subunit PaaJ [Acidimicrobiia bacterium]